MSETKTVTPLLDSFSVGNPISEHHGIRCCPAIKENTDKKYIIKILSVPASQVQMDALLLAGAYKDPADVMEYFRQNGEDILKEAELLKTLSKLDGFLSYEAWQMMPITRRRLGYEIALVGSYKRSLDKYVKRNPVTHLEAMNLGLDLCAALTVCRQAGYLYVDLKPTNIFVSDKKEYRIGDLGFIALDSLSYTALPDKYHSPYTPPELLDPMASVNLTADSYAVGMLLYQLYNDGQLPFKGNVPEGELPSPANADYELAEIIMKAIHPDMQQRWQDPKDLGKALASYMQRNAVNDVPITPHTPLITDPKDIIKPTVKKPASEESSEAETSPAEIAASVEEVEETAQENEQEIQAVPSEEEEALEEICSDPLSEDALSENPVPEDSVMEEPDITEMEDDIEAEEVPTSVEEEVSDMELSDELSRIFAKADDLIAHETPEGVMLPEIQEEADPFSFVEEDPEAVDDSDVPLDPVIETEEDIQARKKANDKTFVDPKYNRRKKRFFKTVLFLLTVCLISLAGFWYYQNIYLLPVEGITIDGDRNQLTVTVDTDIPESKLSITCSDHYGNVVTQGLSGGKAIFMNLQPDTMYTIELDVDGFHALVGKTSDVYTTDATTNIVTFTSVAGSEDGSVVLNFTVDGDEPDEWTVRYSAEGEEEKTETFTGHTVTIHELSVGKVYTFTLDAGKQLSLGGEKTLELMATRLILAENLTVSSSNGTDITVHWKAPGDVVIESWDVRCYNTVGYEEHATVTEPQVTFTGIDPVFSYTIEVTAAGMTQPARTGITANPINISALEVNDSKHDKLTLNWDYTGEAPADGWLLMYSIDGGEKNVVKCEKASAQISPKIPGGKYTFTIQAADGTSVFSNVHSYTCPDAENFHKHGLTSEDLNVGLLKTPEENWYAENVSDDALTNTFAPGDRMSIALSSGSTFYMTGETLNILYVIQDSYGNVLPTLASEESIHWKDIWTGGDSKHGELDVPKLPTSAGEYTLALYFDGMTVAKIPFTITN